MPRACQAPPSQAGDSALWSTRDYPPAAQPEAHCCQSVTLQDTQANGSLVYPPWLQVASATVTPRPVPSRRRTAVTVILPVRLWRCGGLRAWRPGRVRPGHSPEGWPGPGLHDSDSDSEWHRQAGNCHADAQSRFEQLGILHGPTHPSRTAVDIESTLFRTVCTRL